MLILKLEKCGKPPHFNILPICRNCFTSFVTVHRFRVQRSGLRTRAKLETHKNAETANIRKNQNLKMIYLDLKIVNLQVYFGIIKCQKD
jgi:hypothetical protein